MKDLITSLLVLLLCGCSPTRSGNEFDGPKLNAEMQKDGWLYVETLGSPGESVYETRFKSGRESGVGDTVTAFWRTEGKLGQKEYVESEYLYAVVSFQKANGDMFSVVFRRARPSQGEAK
jgi:hypothetical protein